jgi:hypothetical protein
MATRQNFTAIKTLPWLLAVALAGLLQAGATYAAQVVGTVSDLSGPLLVHKADGVNKVLWQKSSVEQGDVLISEKDTYARIKFIDNSEITLKPNSQLKIDNYSYDAGKPENDHAVFSLVKGGLRSITGLLGKRNKDRFGLNTPTATIGIRGTTFIAELVPPAKTDIAAYQAASLASVSSALLNFGDPNAANASRTDAPSDFLPKGTLEMPGTLKPLQLAQNTGGDSGGAGGGRNPGLYVEVLDGVIFLTNAGGTQDFIAGQFGFTPGFQQPPVILPHNPGMQFLPPASFSFFFGSPGGLGNNKYGNVSCEVR